jgi:Spy/CpxP family protein refolding chaperone
MLRLSGKLWTAITVAAVIAMVSQIAVAQNESGRRGRGGRGGAGGPGGFGGLTMSRLVTLDKVQGALKLTDDQKSKIEKINDDARDEMRQEFQSGERPNFEKIQKMRASTAEKVNGLLDEGQRKRLMGIYIQVLGAGAVMDPAVAKELDITAEQKTKIRDAMRSMRGARQQNLSREEMHEKMNKELTSVLTADQQKKLESLKGEKVDIDLSELRGPGGRSGPGRAGRGRPNRGSSDSSDNKSGT